MKRVIYMTKKTHPPNASSPEFQNALIRAILESSPDGVLVVDGQGVVVSYNHRFLEIWDLVPKHQISKPTSEVSIGTEDLPLLMMVSQQVSDPQSFIARVQELYEHPELNDHRELKLKDGRTIERYSSILWSDNHQYLGRVWFFRDITIQKKIEADLVELARHDPLTCIANRRYFFERANQEFTRAQRSHTSLCIASIDIDHFKRFNDSYGHAVGDEMLKSLCRVSESVLRETDLLARIGGEEFAILMPDTTQEGAIHLAERVRQVVSKNKIRVNEQGISCTVSIGIAKLNPTDNGIEDCLHRADKAMYRAKEKGRNRVEG
jgi:diguanylate cyclase (GGDEF)-like protein